MAKVAWQHKVHIAERKMNLFAYHFPQICLYAPFIQSGVIHRAAVDCGYQRLHAEVHCCDIKNCHCPVSALCSRLQEKGERPTTPYSTHDRIRKWKY